MRIYTIASLATLGLAGISSAASGFLQSCYHFDVHDLKGASGRAVRMYAECRNNNGVIVSTNLDLNTCFGWSTSCNFSFPDKEFSSTCYECFNPWNREEDFGKRFGCEGYCEDKNEDGGYKNIASINLDDYIGNDDGTLHC